MNFPGRRLLPRLMRNPVRDWVLLFLAVQCFASLDISTNPNSRWGMLAAMAADHTVRTDHYFQHTMDWARTPDGHYYSNKAPGPALLAFPLFWALDKFTVAGATSRAHADQLRVQARITTLHTISLLTQAVPYGIVTLLVIESLQVLMFPLLALHVTAIALLFGNTATLFMNTFFGHGMAAMLVLAMFLALHRRRPFALGLLYGLAALSDYGASLLILPVAVVIARDWYHGVRWLSWRRFGLLLGGGLLPAVAWVAYHTYCFGGPFALPNKFQNPEFVEVSKAVPRLWGILQFAPDPHALWMLLVSPGRGILFTQGWVFLCLLAVPVLWGPWRASLPSVQLWFARSALILAFLSLCLVLWMNASFNGWDGGSTPGPRYLSLVLPLWAPVLGAIYARWPPVVRQSSVVLVAVSALLFVLVYSTHQLAPATALLPFYLTTTLADSSGEHVARAVYISLGFCWVTVRTVLSLRGSPGAVVTQRKVDDAGATPSGAAGGPARAIR